METELTPSNASSGEPGKDMYAQLNKEGNSVGHQTGSKYQHTVRFERETIEKLEKIQENLDESSFAETVRRVVKEGLTQIRQHHTVFLEFLENLHAETSDSEKKEAIEVVQKEVLGSEVDL